MSSSLLNSIGLGSIDIAYFLIGMLLVIIVLFILTIIQIVKSDKLKKKYDKFMLGKDAKSLEENILTLFKDNEYLKSSSEENRKDIRRIFKNMEYAYQKVGLIKYDAFQHMGGLLSFSLALLNNHNDGFIINSVHSTDGCYSYTKEIKNGECKISLSEEEVNALEIALKSNKKNGRS